RRDVREDVGVRRRVHSVNHQDAGGPRSCKAGGDSRKGGETDWTGTAAGVEKIDGDEGGGAGIQRDGHRIWDREDFRRRRLQARLISERWDRSLKRERRSGDQGQRYHLTDSWHWGFLSFNRVAAALSVRRASC